MAKFTFLIDYSKIKASEKEKEATELAGGSAYVFENFFNAQAMRKFQPKGLEGPNLRAYTRILSKVDDSQDGTIEVEKAELDLLKELTSDELGTIPQQVRLWSYYRSKVEEALK